MFSWGRQEQINLFLLTPRSRCTWEVLKGCMDMAVHFCGRDFRSFPQSLSENTDTKPQRKPLTPSSISFPILMERKAPEGCLTVHLPHEIIWNANLMQLGNFINVFCILSSTCFGYIHPSSGALDVELQHMVCCTEFLDGWRSSESLRRSCVRCDGTIRTAHTTYAAALTTTIHPETRCRKPYAATQHLILLIMGVCTRNMSS